MPETLTSDCSISLAEDQDHPEPRADLRGVFCFCLRFVTEGFTALARPCIQCQCVDNYGGQCAEDIVSLVSPFFFCPLQLISPSPSPQLAR